MAPKTRIQDLLNSFLEVPTADPDDARRRKLLNILLAIVGIASLLAIIATIIVTLFRYLTPQDATSPLIASFASLAGSTIIYLVNRYGSGLLASSFFLILLMIIVALADEPIELAQGRSLYLFVLSIIISSS